MAFMAARKPRSLPRPGALVNQRPRLQPGRAERRPKGEARGVLRASCGLRCEHSGGMVSAARAPARGRGRLDIIRQAE